MDEEFASRSELFVYGRNPKSGSLEVSDRGWEQVKERLLQGLAWGGSPRIELLEDVYEGRGERLLSHHFEGRELELSSAGGVLRQLGSLWRRPVHLLTTENGQSRLLTSDGDALSSKEVKADGSSLAA